MKLWQATSVLAILITTACAQDPKYYTPNPSTHKFDPITEFSSSASVTLINDQPSKDQVLYFKEFSVYGNFNAWTDVAIAVLRRELSKRGMTVRNDGTKSVKLAVTSARTTVSTWQVETVINMRAETRDGYVGTYTGRNRSTVAIAIERQTDGALMRTVAAMLKDPKIVDYLKN